MPTHAPSPFRAFRRATLRDPRFQVLSPTARWVLFALRLDAPNLAGIFPWAADVARTITGLKARALNRALAELQRGQAPWLMIRDGLCWIPSALEEDAFFALRNSKHRRHVELVLGGYPEGTPLVAQFRKHFELADPAMVERDSGKGIRKGNADRVAKGNADTQHLHSHLHPHEPRAPARASRGAPARAPRTPLGAIERPEGTASSKATASSPFSDWPMPASLAQRLRAEHPELIGEADPRSDSVPRRPAP